MTSHYWRSVAGNLIVLSPIFIVWAGWMIGEAWKRRRRQRGLARGFDVPHTSMRTQE